MKLTTLLVISVFFGSFQKLYADDSTTVFKEQTVIVYKIQTRDTYYSIAREYNVEPIKLMAFNDNKPLRIGDVIYIQRRKSLSTLGHNIKSEEQTHIVSAGETLFSIAGLYRISVDQIKALNNLENSDIYVGQRIKINEGYSGEEDIAANDNYAENAINTQDNTLLKAQTLQSVYHADTLNPAEYTMNAEMDTTARIYKKDRQIKEIGIGMWTNDADLNQAKSIALHRSAPAGTIILITNPMNRKSLFVKVVGAFAPNNDNSEALIIISKSAAELLDIRDHKFRIDLSYSTL